MFSLDQWADSLGKSMSVQVGTETTQIKWIFIFIIILLEKCLNESTERSDKELKLNVPFQGEQNISNYLTKQTSKLKEKFSLCSTSYFSM